MFIHYSCIEVWAMSFCNCNTLCFIIRFCFWIFDIVLLLLGNLKVKFFFIKFKITNILILLLWNFKDRLILQFPCPLMIQVIMEILFEVLMTSLFLPKYKCCMNERFLSKVNIKSNRNMTYVVELLVLLLILSNLLKTNNFNSIVISVLITVFVVSTRQAFRQSNFFISSVKEFLYYCYLDAIR